MDTSVLIALSDPLDRFHTQSVTFVNSMKREGIECLSGSPLLVEVGKMAEIRGTERCLDVINSMEEFSIHLTNIDLVRMLDLEKIYLEEGILTKRHHLDLLHYATASLLGCTYLASWNSRHFNDQISKKVSSVNMKHRLSSLIAGKPDCIMKREKLGQA